MIVIIDNYDSFTYNLVDLVKRSTEVLVFRNDEITAEDIVALNPLGVLISPGPGRPEDSNVSWDFAFRYHKTIPILGVCLGHQILGQVMGMQVVKAQRPMHGKTSQVYHKGESLFQNLPSPFQVMRYHSLLLDRGYVPQELLVTAETAEQEIMGIQHRSLPLTGLQFHPESVLSEYGEQMIRSWLSFL